MRLLAGFPDKSNPNRLSVGFNPSSSSPSGPWTFRIHQPSRRQLCLCYAVRVFPVTNCPYPLRSLKASKSKEGQPAELVLFVRMVNGVGETPGTWKYQLLIAGDLRTSELIDIAPSHLLHPDHFATSSSVRIEYPSGTTWVQRCSPYHLATSRGWARAFQWADLVARRCGVAHPFVPLALPL